MDTDRKQKLLYVVTEESYFLSHRLQLAKAALQVGYDVAVATGHLEHKKTLEDMGFRVIPIEFFRTGGSLRHLLREWSVIRKLTRIYREEKPDIVHHIALQPIIYGSIAAYFAKVPKVVHTIAGLGFVFVSSTFKARILRTIFRRIFKWSFNRKNSRIILQNSDDKQYLMRLGIRPEQMVLIYGSGVDVQKFQVVPEPASMPVVTVVARMLKFKGIGEFVAAVRQLKQKKVQFDAWLVGDPDPDSLVSVPTETLQAWHREELVRWLGHQSEIADIWRRSHIAVLPSYREGLPKSLLEAAACGKPIIATDVPGCREVVREGENGYLVPLKDIDALAQAIQQLVENAELRRKMGQASRQLVENQFSLEQVIRETLAVYGLGQISLESKD